MASVTSPTWFSNSSQLRLAFSGRKSSSAVLVHLRVQKLVRQVRVSAVGESGDGGDLQGRSGSSWSTNSSFSADASSGWADDPNGGGEEELSESQPKRWPGGIVGAGVAGAVLVAGLAFAALSINRSASRPKQKMEPLTTQQEESLSSADKNGTVEKEDNEGNSPMLENSSLESKTGIDKDTSSYSENKETTTENTISHDTDVGYTSTSKEVINNDSSQNHLQEELVSDDIQVNPVESPNLPGSEVHGDPAAASIDNSVHAESLELSAEPKEDLSVAKITNSPLSDVNPTTISTDYQEVVLASPETKVSNYSLDSSPSSSLDALNEPVAFNISVSSQLDVVSEPQTDHKDELEAVSSHLIKEDLDFREVQEYSAEENKSSLEAQILNGGGLSGTSSVSALAYPFANEQNDNGYNDLNKSGAFFGSMNLGNFSSSASIPAPSIVSPALQALPGKVLVPAIVDQVQGQALAALQVLKVIEGDVQPGDLCTRREYARWLVSASGALSRSTLSKVYPAMYIENVSELAFDDITPEDPDFSSIQGLAEAGLIASKLSRHDMNYSLDQDESPQCFCPESPVSRQDLVSWKMSLEKRQLPVTDRKSIQQVSGFMDIDKINPDAWPALMADLSAGENGIIALAFGFTRLFQPDKPVTKAQAAIALATGESSDIVSEELTRIEAESVAEKAVAAHSALVDQVEKDVNANFEKELFLEREKINAVELLAEETRRELERLRAERDKENIVLVKERAAVDSEMELLSRLRREVEEQLQGLLSNKVAISYEKERISKLRQDAETENQEIARVQYELEVERKALSMARAWAEDEAKRAIEQAKVLEEARDRWESRGIKVVVENDLREEVNAGVSWLNAGDQFSVEATFDRSEKLVDRLKTMAAELRGKSRETVDKVIQKILCIISALKEWALKAARQAGELKDSAMSRTGDSLQGMQQSSAEFSVAVKEGAKRVAGDCREGVEKWTQKFKT